MANSKALRRTAAVASIGLVIALLTYSRARLFSPSPTLILHDRTGEFLAEVGTEHDQDGGYWPVAVVPEKVLLATLAAEDRRFYSHPGVDLRAIGRALWQNLHRGHRHSGASTLAMQIVRMEYPGSRTWLRKASEALTALWLTAKYDRPTILRHYLQLAPYGNRVRGIGFAARRYLDKPAEDLSWAEAAFLAALPQAPGRMNPFSNQGRQRAVFRAKGILDYLEQQGRLSPEDNQVAHTRLDSLQVPMLSARPASALHAVLHLEHELTGCRADPNCPVYTLADRPIVETTIDSKLQDAVMRTLSQRVTDWRADGAGNAAAIVLDAKSGEVLAWVGSTQYNERDMAGGIDFTQVRRSPGSTLKPFFYALALERGAITPATVLADIRRPDGLVNDADDSFLGPLLPRVALANSRNIPAVEVLERVGFPSVWDLLEVLRLRPANGPPVEQYGPGLVLGNLPVTLADLVRAYLTLSNDGELRELVWRRGQSAPESCLSAPDWRMECGRTSGHVFSQAVTRQIALFLSDPQARLPTFPRLGHLEYPFPVAVKTGTSSGFHDSWAVAYSAQYLVGVWVGHPEFRSMRELSGFRAAAAVVHDLMFLLPHPDAHGLAELSFPPPHGSHPVRLCALSGKRAQDACDQVTVEWFSPGTEPLESCDLHQRRAVDRRNGALATVDTPKDKLQVRTFVELPAMYSEWAAHAGLHGAPDTSTRDDSAVRSIVASTVHIRSPRDGMRIVRDPEMPQDDSTLGLLAAASPTNSQVVWYVDGEPYKTVGYPFSIRWPLQSGEHTFQARLAYQATRSEVVRVRIE